MRLFFGLVVPDSGRKEVNTVINCLKEQYDGKYTDIDNLHITLAFIGEVEAKVSYMLAQIGDKAFSNLEILPIRAQGVNNFKDGKVTYLRVEKFDALNNLHNRLINLLDEANVVYNHDEGYTPHITLRRGNKTPIVQETEPIDMSISTVALFESKRVDGVLRYVPIAKWSGEER